MSGLELWWLSMSKYEVLSILVSVISAFVALWAIVVSRRTAEEQKNIAHRTQILESRNLIATHHGKYSELLFSVQSQTRQYAEELSEAAYSALDELIRLFDKFGVIPPSGELHPRQTRQTRHIFYKECERLYQSFNPHLTSRNGMNLRSRFNALRDINSKKLSESEVERLEREAKAEDIQLEKAYREDSNEELESRVIESYEFRVNVQKLLSRISIKDRPIIFQEALQKLVPFIATYESGKEVLALAQKKLGDGLAQNELEEFSLKESPELLEAYKQELAKLEILQNLDLTDIGCMADMQVKNSIPELIFMGAMLYTISMYSSWGQRK